MTYPEEKTSLFNQIIGNIAENLYQASSRKKKPLILDHNGNPIRASYHQISRTAASRSGSLRNWIPKRIFSDQQEKREREDIVDRSIDLANNDPSAAGVIDTFATTIIGSGLNPFPNFTPEEVGLTADDREKVRSLKKQARNIVKTWSPFSDASGRLDFGGLQHLALSTLVSHGEYLFLLPMIKDPSRPYSLAMQVISPLRLKTPIDLKSNKNIHDGVEIGEYGEAKYYWIKKAERRKGELPDTKENFVKIPARVNHRLNVIHNFYATGPEQYRGIPWFAPAIKFFRDRNDLLDAELVSQVVTAAFSLFIEVAEDEDPDYPSLDFTNFTDSNVNSDGQVKQQRYSELVPGIIRYGNAGETPHTISADRPGITFEPFIKIIESAISMSVNLPRAVLFKNFDSMNYASYRSAMLEAWRVFKTRRIWFANGFCNPSYRMLLEEAYLRNTFTFKNFYKFIWPISGADWIGPPKGQIEPVKEIEADEKAHKLKVKSRREIALERSSDIGAVFDQLEDEQQELERRNLMMDEETIIGDLNRAFDERSRNNSSSGDNEDGS